MKTCFVASPIGNPKSDTRIHADKFLKYIVEPACLRTGFTASRSDQFYGSDYVDRMIIEQLASCDLVIADLSEKNPNVYFEVGYRLALGLPLVITVRMDEDVKFDISTLRQLKFDPSFSADNVEWAVDELVNHIKAEESKNHVKPILGYVQQSEPKNAKDNEIWIKTEDF